MATSLKQYRSKYLQFISKQIVVTSEIYAYVVYKDREEEREDPKQNPGEYLMEQLLDSINN